MCAVFQIALVACQLARPIVEALYAESRLDFGGPNDSRGDAIPPQDQMAAVRAWLEGQDPEA